MTSILLIFMICVGLALLALMFDWFQTLTIAGHPERFSEVNPILGQHPSKTAVNVYFIAWMLITVGVAGALYLTSHLIIGICLTLALALFEFVVVLRNKSLGVSLLQ
ncbi:hypothetical protein CR51_36220 [Caballeronia megalochromosomata]|jgi:hypothetical protein|nr:hypothetical protein CR51_36220 [Caballeronia megalochromosomata]